MERAAGVVKNLQPVGTAKVSGLAGPNKTTPGTAKRFAMCATLVSLVITEPACATSRTSSSAEKRSRPSITLGKRNIASSSGVSAFRHFATKASEDKAIPRKALRARRESSGAANSSIVPLSLGKQQRYQPDRQSAHRAISRQPKSRAGSRGAARRAHDSRTGFLNEMRQWKVDQASAAARCPGGQCLRSGQLDRQRANCVSGEINP